MTPSRYVMDFERPLVDLEEKLEGLRKLDLSASPELVQEIEELAARVEALHDETYYNLSPWDRVQMARHPDRPKTDDYLEALFTDVLELHGDRAFRDDEAIFSGFATLGGRRLMVLGHRKGRDTKQNVRRNFGSPHPEGYRKAIRAMKLADKFGLPIVTLIDTAGAFPGVEAEERGQAWAIAEALATLAGVRVPIVNVGIGEGGSGGALAIGFGDALIMLENSYYTVSTPEACASILWRDAAMARDAASALRLTAADLVDFGIADEIIFEPLGGAHRDPGPVILAVGEALERRLDALCTRDGDEVAESRYLRLRAIGEVCRVRTEE